MAARANVFVESRTRTGLIGFGAYLRVFDPAESSLALGMTYSTRPRTHGLPPLLREHPSAPITIAP